MHPKRLIKLQEGYRLDTTKYVLYWMQQSQRVHYNHALNHAIRLANSYHLPLVVFFGLTKSYPEANERHYHFMLEGLQEVKAILIKFGVNFVFKLESPEIGIQSYLEDAQALVMDYGYLGHLKLWRKQVLDVAVERYPYLKVDMIETDTIVPVKYADDKAAYGAYTIRPKIKRLYQSFRDFKRIETLDCHNNLSLESDDALRDIDGLLARLDIDHQVKKSPIYRGGYIACNQLFNQFVQEKINHYSESNDPSKDLTSKLSMYLHFGQVSSLEILDKLFLLMSQQTIDGASFDAFIEQLMIRRELAFNYVTYHKGYDQFETMTEPWAYQTMQAHEFDHKPYVYSKEDIEKCRTHDPYFNAAMKEMVVTGYMHNYMRMYWAKKIIEWSPSFKTAYETIISLNNKYFIDGRDPNSYAGVAWCFGKHDRPWTERTIFGKLRYMNDKGLERKFDIKGYVDRIEKLSRT